MCWCAGGGLKHSTVMYVEDQVQEFHVQIEICHKVSCKQSSCVASQKTNAKFSSWKEQRM